LENTHQTAEGIAMPFFMITATHIYLLGEMWFLAQNAAKQVSNKPQTIQCSC